MANRESVIKFDGRKIYLRRIGFYYEIGVSTQANHHTYGISQTQYRPEYHSRYYLIGWIATEISDYTNAPENRLTSSVLRAVAKRLLKGFES